MPEIPPFEIDVTPEPGGRHRVTVGGELDLASAPRLREALRASADAAREVLLDLSAVTFIDSSGLSLLVAVDAESRADGFGFGLVAGPVVRRLVELCDLQDTLPLRD